jgi:hypothetical protein
MKKRPSPNVELERLLKLLEAVFMICAMHPSVSEKQLDRLIKDARGKGSRRVAARWKSRGTSVDFDALGLVLHRWTRTARYLTDDGEPIALSPRGRSLSIESLFRDVKRSSYFELGLRHLERIGQIKKNEEGLFLPVRVTIIVPTLTPELFDVLAQAIHRLVATVIFNTSSAASKSARLIERMTYIPDLPKNKVPSFKRFAREQGAALIETMDDWLESNRGTTLSSVKNRKHLVPAGFHVFSFLEE